MFSLVTSTGRIEEIKQGTIRPGVLVVDDNDSVRTILSRELQNRGFVVFSAMGGDEALCLYSLHADQIDLILMDVNMPDLDGIETHAMIRAEAPQVRCCFMTADMRPGLKELLFENGALSVFCKPFSSLSELCDRLRWHASEPIERCKLNTPVEMR